MQFISQIYRRLLIVLLANTRVPPAEFYSAAAIEGSQGIRSGEAAVAAVLVDILVVPEEAAVVDVVTDGGVPRFGDFGCIVLQRKSTERLRVV